MTQYGILDDFDAVVRWIDYKPEHGRFITRKVAKPRKHGFADVMAKCGAAPF